MKQIPYWVDTAHPIPSYANRPLPERADVVVVGGGLTGLSAALHLAKRGARVTLVERHQVGWGASSRNGGQCNTGITIPLGKAIERFGIDGALRLHRMSVESVDFVEQLVRAEKIDCDFRRAGRLGLAFKPAHFERLRAQHELLAKRFNFRTELISRTDLRREIGSELYHGGLLEPRGAAIHPGKFVRGLAVAAARSGADLHEETAATQIVRQGNKGFVVNTTRGPVRAAQVMVATDGYTDQAYRELQRRILAIGSFIITTEPLSEELAHSVSPGRRNMVDTKNFSFYFRLTPDNRMLFGGRARFALSNPESDQACAQILKQGLTSVFPQLSESRIDYVWGGTVGFTMDKLPHAGEINGVYYAVGYCGHGVQMGPYVGKCMADVMNGRPEANPLRGIDFPKIPLASQTPWYLPVAGAYFKFLDWIS